MSADSAPHKPSGHLKNMAVTSAGTMGSRFLGLVRDQLIAAFFGTSGAASAFILAFQIPNLFRRLLGEGALTAALVPVMSHERKLGGKERAFAFLNLTLRRVAPPMFAVSALLAALAWLVGAHWSGLAALLGFEPAAYQELAARLTAVCMPYMPLICLAAVVTAALNMLGRFGITSLSAVWLNVSMIGALLIGSAVCDTDEGRVLWLCSGAILGGALQLAVPALGLWREGWRPGLREPACSPDAWGELRAIFVPAVIGAGVQQINLFLTRFLAFSADERALSVYYYANRVVELPVGVFAVAVSTVIFPALAMHAAHDDRRSLARDLEHGLRLVFAVNIAASAGMIALAEPIVRALFRYGKFNDADTMATIPVLCVFALSVPFFAVAGLLGRTLNAFRETRFQMRLAWRVLLVNAVAAPPLGWWLGAPGLALANLIAAVWQVAELSREVRRRDAHLAAMEIVRPLLRCLAAGAIMAGLAWAGWRFADSLAPGSRRAAILGLLTLVPAGAAVYFAILRAWRYPETEDIAAMARRVLRRVGL